ncbi:MAG: sigma-54 dependent transcriptional regulator [Gammaproteobacteria bacterium]|nr:sigma-54 dependent transcriptional regulator [Gammaproteobacteria bacterium]
MKTVLIVDDDDDFADGLAQLIRLKGHNCATAGTLEEARQALDKQAPSLLLLDLILPDGSGLELLEDIGDNRPERIVLITGHSAITQFVNSVAGPGISYLTKPVETQEVFSILDSLSAGGYADDSDQPAFGLLIGSSDAMQKVYQQIRQVAPTESTVFVQGESGTGKELIAEAVHRESGLSGPFVPVNCGGLTPELIGSELFGHEKGSFTGAAKQHKGYFERAAHGTLFLDEITEMPMDMQTQLLRVLESNRFTRVGGTQEIDCTARLVAATNRDPAVAVQENKLREDLYFRLQVFPIRLPKLAARNNDLAELAQHFLDALNSRNAQNKAFADGFIDSLQEHTWPGNVRELKNVIARQYILSDGDTVAPPDSFDAPLSGTAAPAVGQSIRDVEKQLIMSTLEHFDGDKKATAATLGVSLKTLYNRLKDYEESS